jgi:hypothetical protein
MKNALLLCAVSIFSLHTLAQDHKDYILALSVELYMNTSAQVSCENFATKFKIGIAHR